jgi:hypothetical protein
MQNRHLPDEPNFKREKKQIIENTGNKINIRTT